jgi:hypothetical protein
MNCSGLYTSLELFPGLFVKYTEVMKMKKLVVLCLAILLLQVASVGCTNQNDIGVAEQSGAYFTVFENLYAASPGLNTDSTYLAMDLTKAELTDTEPLISLMQNFCDENGYILMLDTADGLKEKGYIIDLGFPEGFLIVFEDVRLENSTLITNAMKWRSGDGAVGAEYTVRYRNNSWEIAKTDNSWMS